MKSFSKNDDDIQTIESFELKLNVTDPKPVWKPYRTIPKQLYSEGKQYLEDLNTNNWRKKFILGTCKSDGLRQKKRRLNVTLY